MVALLAAAAAGAPLLATSCGDETPARHPVIVGPPTQAVGRPVNVLLITLDTTRADHLGSYGHARVQTPALDALAAEGTLFQNAFTPIPSTFPSHATLMTGLYPASHGVHDNAVYFLGAEQTTLAETLRERGWATGAFVSAFVLDRQFGLDQGFEAYDDRVDQPLMRGEPPKPEAGGDAARRKWEATIATAYQRRGDATTDAAIAWLSGLGARPFFLWVHYFDAHQPYQPPPPWDRAFDPGYRGAMDGDQRLFWNALERKAIRREDVDHMIARYDGEISWLDTQVARLLAGVQAVGRRDETLVVAVADHGEGLGEHAQIFEHNGEVYDETVHVPLIVRRPDAGARGERVAALVRTLDVAPTILDWLHLDPDVPMQGRSLLPFTDAAAATRTQAEGAGEVLLEAMRERQINPAAASLLGLRGEGFKVVLTMAASAAGAEESVQRVELYDLAADPSEKRDLAAAQPERAAKLRERTLAAHRALPRPAKANARELQELDSEALRALGYAGK